MKPDLIIVGAGLNGLLLAHLLQGHYRITLLEARPRIGGRILTVEEAGERFDLGPTWVWPHQHHIRHLVDALGLTLFRHYDQGAFAYDAPEGVQYFRTGQNAPSYRIEGGAGMLTSSLAERLGEVDIRLETPVRTIASDGEGVTVHTDGEALRAAHCIVTLPPRLCADTIAFEPPLAAPVREKMLAIPTWMGFSSKCIVTYAEPFWRARGLSGFATSHRGPLSEVHDASTRNKGALFGFYHTRSADDAQPERVFEQLTRLFGPEARDYEVFRYHNWRSDPYTSVPADREPLDAHPRYGMETAVSECLHFCGTETESQEGGYLEGAVIAAMRLAKTLMEA
ncbi:FAD-dependent oxidoreductase [Sulfurimonas sp. HSL1-2]|uniref:flavin monoamine oxidase family protein n=1 Tax=Thiomicrolovo zhangzhouensis TaxID=3131933 RepID=UPI0031F7344C